MEAVQPFSAVLLLFFLIGVSAFRFSRVFSIWMLGIPTILSLAQLYPFFGGRVNLYLVPVVAVAFAGLAQSVLIRRGKPSLKWVAQAVLATTLLPVAVSFVVFGKPENKRDIAWVIAEYENRREDTDLFTMPIGAPYDWYRSDSVLESPGFVNPGLIAQSDSYEDRNVWILSTVDGTEPIISSLADTHSLACRAVVGHSEIHVLRPRNAGPIPPGFCEINVPKT